MSWPVPFPPSAWQFLVEAGDWFGPVMTRVGPLAAVWFRFNLVLDRPRRAFVPMLMSALHYDSQTPNRVSGASGIGVRRGPPGLRSRKEQSVRPTLVIQSILEVWGSGAC